MNRRGCTCGLLVALAIVPLLVWCLLPGDWIVELPLAIAFGWVQFLGRVVPTLNPDPWTVGTGLACLVGVIVGAHLFLRWLHRATATQPDTPRWPLRRTLRLVAMVVVMFVAGIAVVGVIHQTSWLARSPEPLFGNRLAAKRTASANSLKQIVIAAEKRLEFGTPKELPRSTFSAAGEPLHSWQTALLPYIAEDPLYKRIDLAKPWTHPANAEPMGAYIPIFRNPAFSDDKVNGFGASDYAGNVAVVLGDPKTMQSFPAGTSNTILAGEVSSGYRAWGDPLNARDPRHGASGGPYGFGARGRPPLFVMLDGSVRTFDPQELAELMSKTSE
jgi:hypothetical protein